MTSAFVPHDRPPRLIRYVDDLGVGILSVLDYEQNLLLIAKPLFEGLAPQDQRDVQRTNEPALSLWQRVA
jgi:hypothetical protein